MVPPPAWVMPRRRVASEPPLLRRCCITGSAPARIRAKRLRSLGRGSSHQKANQGLHVIVVRSLTCFNQGHIQR